jgi:hypothetical protein
MTEGIKMNYGLTSKQLSKIKIRWELRPEEIDIEGWFEDGQRDAIKGKQLNYGCAKLKENQDAYIKGYNSIN